MRPAVLLMVALLFASASSVTAAESTPLLATWPTMSQSHIVFVYGGTLWSVPRDGGDARQLTTGGHETRPRFSPDGRWIAFTGQYDGNADVYVIPAEGGEPRRLTWHPQADLVTGWTPDGRRVVFSSKRESYSDFQRLYTVPVEGGVPVALPMWRAQLGAYSPDGTRFAYQPIEKWQEAWKRYHGGQTTPIYLVRLSDLQLEKVPRENSNDDQPVWIGDTVYFLSDRHGPVTLFAYDTRAKTVKQVLANDGLDLKSICAGPGGIVYEQFGGLHVYDLASGTSHAVAARVAGDLPATRPHYEKVADRIQAARLSPSGARAVFEARGEILTVPAEKGDIRDLTRTTGAAERDPAWSPDGRWIAYFSDASGEYALHVADPTGLGEVRAIPLGAPPSFFYAPLWSPDSKKIAYTDKRLNLWVVDVDKKTPVKVETDLYDAWGNLMTPAWSPDSRWLAYTRFLPNHQRAVFLYGLDAGKRTQVTDGMSDARYPAFDRGRKYLYLTASTDLALSGTWLDLSGIEHPVTRSVYAVVLKRGDPDPVAPQSDEEKSGDAGKAKAAAAKKADSTAVFIDLDGLAQRIVALPIPPANFVSLDAGKAGTLFVTETPLVDPTDGDGGGTVTISKYDLTTRKTEPFLAGVRDYAFSADGEKVLYSTAPGSYAIAGTATAPKPGEGALKLDDLQVLVDPRAEWAQMYHEVWRIERDFFYAPNFHGLDLAAAEKRYAPYLAGVGGREDLNHLFEEMLGELTVGHMFIRGGDVPRAPTVKGGLLGADYTVASGRYRIARIFTGESWNPTLHAPLAEPGVDVNVGDYVIAIDGREVRPPDDISRFLENTAGRQVSLKVSAEPGGRDARAVTVVPVADEFALRNRAWEEDNRRAVDRLSGGKLAYVHVPDTGGGGFANFNRFFFAQADKQGVIIDERFNHGGLIADYIIDLLKRPLRCAVVTREGEKWYSPLQQVFGPRTMIINEMAGSGGDALPWLFHQENVGTLVGTRTWGGLVGIGGFPALMDGGRINAPRAAIYGLHGDWEVENHGIAPDVVVENDPASVAAGHDPQLEKAVEVTLAAMKTNPVVIPDHPPFPDYQKK